MRRRPDRLSPAPARPPAAGPQIPVEGGGSNLIENVPTAPLLPLPAPPAGQQIRLKGRNLTENEHVKLGAYHTLELELQRAFTLYKVGRVRPSSPRLTRPIRKGQSLCCGWGSELVGGAVGQTGVRPLHACLSTRGAPAARPRPAIAPAAVPAAPAVQDAWDSVDTDRIKTACDPAASADLAVLLITVSCPFTRSCYTFLICKPWPPLAHYKGNRRPEGQALKAARVAGRGMCMLLGRELPGTTVAALQQHTYVPRMHHRESRSCRLRGAVRGTGYAACRAASEGRGRGCRYGDGRLTGVQQPLGAAAAFSLRSVQICTSGRRSLTGRLGALVSCGLHLHPHARKDRGKHPAEARRGSGGVRQSHGQLLRQGKGCCKGRGRMLCSFSELLQRRGGCAVLCCAAPLRASPPCHVLLTYVCA